MKSLPKFLALAAVCTGGAAFASPGSEALVTLRTIEQYTVPGTILRDEAGFPVRPTVPAFENEWVRYDSQGNVIQENYEYQSKAASWRLSNREFLGFLVSEGVIPAIAGWSLRAIYNEEETLPYFYITKPGFAPIYVGNYFDLETYGEASTVRAKSQTRYNAAGNVISSRATDNSTTKSELLLTFSTRDLSSPLEEEGSTMNLQGMWRHTLSLRPVNRTEYVYIPGPGAINAISGTINDVVADGEGGFDYYESIVEGSWGFSGARFIGDLSVLFPEAEPAAASN